MTGRSLDPFSKSGAKDAKRICDPGHTGQVIVIDILVHKGMSSRRRPENHKVVNPLEHGSDFFRMQNFDAGISRCTLDSTHGRQPFNGIVLYIDGIPPGDHQVFLVGRDNRQIPVCLDHVLGCHLGPRCAQGNLMTELGHAWAWQPVIHVSVRSHIGMAASCMCQGQKRDQLASGQSPWNAVSSYCKSFRSFVKVDILGMSGQVTRIWWDSGTIWVKGQRSRMCHKECVRAVCTKYAVMLAE